MPELAILNHREAVRSLIPISQPTLPDFDRYSDGLREIFASRQITNDRWVRDLERKAAEYLGCREVVALSNATSGLVLLPKLLGFRGEVCLPSFTFPATLHALLWNGLPTRLVDCDPETFNLDVASLESALEHGAKAFVPVYIFGNSPDWDRLNPLIEARGMSCYSDAAHALGTRWGAVQAGSFGDAEVFSLAPTKVTVAGEGGLVATNSFELARDLRLARNYGNPGDYDCVMAGLNARMSELHALLAFLCLEDTEKSIARRQELVAYYRAALSGTAGVRFQKIEAKCRSTFNYFAVLLDEAEFGLSNREMQLILRLEGVQSRIYFAPPLHRQTRFAHLFAEQGPFPGTEKVLAQVLCLPLYTHMGEETVDQVVEVVRACHRRAEELRPVVRRRLAEQEATLSRSEP